MVKQKVPDIAFDWFVLGEIGELFDKNRIKINPDYQRSDMWKHQQMIELIRSIEKRYSIGIIVLFINSDNQYEILDGQQRLLTIKKYVKDNLNLDNAGIKKYSELDKKDKILLDAYCIYYLRLKSFDEESKEEDITQTFLRLQEGTPLNKAEKINAYRGKFKDTFRALREKHSLFDLLGKEKRFRWRLLAAEFLLLELEGDFENKKFPALDLPTFKNAIKNYETNISEKKLTFLKGNLDLLHSSLNNLLTAIQPRELISFYLLISYLRKNKADNSNIINEFRNFAEDFLKIINSFSVYDTEPPSGLKIDLFKEYLNYKTEARQATTSESLSSRFNFILKEYQRLHPFIFKDKERLHDTEQKRTLFFRQRGFCPECKKYLNFSDSSSHHVISNSIGGKTDNLDEAVLLHEKCHKKLEKRIKKNKK